MCAQELPKVANLAHSRVARNGQKWQCNCFQIWLILELPGMAMVCAQEFPKVAIMFCFQIWLFPWSCQEWQCIYVSKSGSFQFPKVAIMFCFQIWLFPWSCQEWSKLAMYMFPWSCQEWQWCVQDLETDTLPLLAITEHTPLPFLATPRFGNRYCHCWQSLSTHASLPLLATTK